MSGSTFGKWFRVTTFGESHGPALGVVIDGVPAGLPLSEDLLLEDLKRRRPGQSKVTTARKEADQPEILSGVFEGQTTGTPIAVLVRNTNARSSDYEALKDVFRPGHADYGFAAKYGIRDYRGGGRSSGRETVARVIAGAVAKQMLAQLGICVRAWTRSIGPVQIDSGCLQAIPGSFGLTGISEDAWQRVLQSPVGMPDPKASEAAEAYLAECRSAKDSAGGVICCSITGVPAGVGEPVFDKLDARLAQAIFSIGGVKGFEIGDGFTVAGSTGSENNDPFVPARGLENDRPLDARTGGITKATNHAGGILGGLSDGTPILFSVALKPTPSISQSQLTVNTAGEAVALSIEGRHDPVIVPRAVVVVEAMAALTIADALLEQTGARMETLRRIYDISQS